MLLQIFPSRNAAQTVSNQTSVLGSGRRGTHALVTVPSGAAAVSSTRWAKSGFGRAKLHSGPSRVVGRGSSRLQDDGGAATPCTAFHRKPDRLQIHQMSEAELPGVPGLAQLRPIRQAAFRLQPMPLGAGFVHSAAELFRTSDVGPGAGHPTLQFLPLRLPRAARPALGAPRQGVPRCRLGGLREAATVERAIGIPPGDELRGAEAAHLAGVQGGPAGTVDAVRSVHLADREQVAKVHGLPPVVCRQAAVVVLRADGDLQGPRARSMPCSRYSAMAAGFMARRRSSGVSCSAFDFVR